MPGLLFAEYLKSDMLTSGEKKFPAVIFTIRASTLSLSLPMATMEVVAN